MFYWNVTTGVRAYVESREEFTVQLCPMPDVPFPPRVADYVARRKIEWFDAWDVERLVTGRRWKRFSPQQRYGPDLVVIAAYAEALRGPCRPLLGGDAALWERLRRQRRARIASNLRLRRAIRRTADCHCGVWAERLMRPLGPCTMIVRVTNDNRADWVKQARAALIVAAMRRTILTYGELGKALGMEGVALRNLLPRVLDDLSVECDAANEPSLAALVVNQEEGRPGSGWIDGAVPWHAEIQKCFRHWMPR